MNHLKKIALGLVALTLLASSPSLLRAQQATIEGNWKALSVKCSGLDCEAAQGLECNFAAEKIMARYGEKTITVGYRLGKNDERKRFIVTKGDQVAWSGIYALEQDKLTICVILGDGDPPTELATQAGDGRVLVELERVK